MILGFTGTQKGMSPQQMQMIREYLTAHEVSEIHHGDCIGADASMHDLATEFDIPVVIHPPSNDSKRAFCKGDKTLAPKPYLKRNYDIVNASEVLIATPGTYAEQLRSGTWATIRCAVRKRIVLRIVFPDGSIKHHI